MTLRATERSLSASPMRTSHPTLFATPIGRAWRPLWLVIYTVGALRTNACGLGTHAALPQIEIDDVRCFLADMRHGNFRRAANPLNMKQPRFPRNIGDLEEQARSRQAIHSVSLTSGRAAEKVTAEPYRGERAEQSALSATHSSLGRPRAVWIGNSAQRDTSALW